MKVSEIPGMNDQYAGHEPANFVASIIVVNPWDNPQDPDDREEPTTGAYVAYVSMIADTQVTYVEWHDVNAFHSFGTSKTKVWVCPDDDLECTFDEAESSIDSNTVPGNANQVKFDVLLSIDMDHLFRPSSFYKIGMADWRDSLYKNIFDHFTFEMHFTRDVTLDFGVNAGNIVSSSGADPYADAVVFTTDSRVDSPLKSTMDYHQGIASRSYTDTASNFRAYADKGLGIDLPNAWIWGMGQWVDVNQAPNPNVASMKKTTVYIGGGKDPSDNVWKATVFIRYDNPRSGLMDYIYRTAATDPWGTTNPGGWRTQVCNYENPPASAYYDQDGTWKISTKWTVIIRPYADALSTLGHCYLEEQDANGNWVPDGHCLGVVNGQGVSQAKERAMITITSTTGRIVDLAIPAMSIQTRNGNPELDTFHDFEALNATVALSMQYCDDGEWKWEKAPNPKHPDDPTKWRDDWPIYGAFGGFEWGMFQGRINDQDLIALPKITRETSGNQETFSYSMRNIGKAAANGAVLELFHWEKTNGVWGWTSKSASAAQNLQDGANLNLDELSDWGHPVDTTADTYTGSFQRAVNNGNAAGFANRLGGAFFVRNGLGGQGGQNVLGAGGVAISACDIWKVSADSTNAVAEYSEINNDWQSGPNIAGVQTCLAGVAVNNMKATLGGAMATKTSGTVPMAVTFVDGSSSKTFSTTSGDPYRLDMKFWLSEAEYVSRDLVAIEVPVTFLREDTGFESTFKFTLPVVYTFDLNADGGVSLWNGDAAQGHEDAVATQVATGVGGYDHSQNSYMQRAVDLSEAQQASTSFWYWIDVQKNNDFLVVEASSDESSWVQLDQFSLDSTISDPGAATWLRYDRDLTPYVGQIVFLRLRFVADAAVSGPGVRIDEWTVLQAHHDTETADFADGTYDTGEMTAEGGSLSLIEADGAYPSESAYTSFAREFGSQLEFEAFSFAGQLPPQTAILVQVRSGKTASEMLAASWRGPDGTADTYFDFPGTVSLSASSAAGDVWFQYELTMVSWDTARSPVVDDVTWLYTCSLTEHG